MARADDALRHAEHHDIDWRGLGWSLPTRILGTVLGVLLVVWFPPAGLGVALGLMVLLSVLLTVKHVEVPVSPGTLSVAGFVSGVTGTAGCPATGSGRACCSSPGCPPSSCWSGRCWPCEKVVRTFPPKPASAA